MNILTTRFGLIQACESDLILVPGRIARVSVRSLTSSICPIRS